VPAKLNKSHIDLLLNIPDSWMLRECDSYKDEMKFCGSMSGRFHQFYVHGKQLDCAQWEQTFTDCKLWTRDADVDAAKRIIASEKERIKTRLQGHYANDVWEKREKAPEDWNKPLPEYLEKKKDSSYLKMYVEAQTERAELDAEGKAIGLRASVINSYPTCSIL